MQFHVTRRVISSTGTTIFLPGCKTSAALADLMFCNHWCTSQMLLIKTMGFNVVVADWPSRKTVLVQEPSPMYQGGGLNQLPSTDLRRPYPKEVQMALPSWLSHRLGLPLEELLQGDAQ